MAISAGLTASLFRPGQGLPGAWWKYLNKINELQFGIRLA